jgi:hypothetical protein
MTLTTLPAKLCPHQLFDNIVNKAVPPSEFGIAAALKWYHPYLLEWCPDLQ